MITIADEKMSTWSAQRQQRGYLRRDTVTGDLSFRNSVTTPDQDVFDTLALSPDGTHLYVAGKDGISIYDRSSSGELTPSDLTSLKPSV